MEKYRVVRFLNREKCWCHGCFKELKQQEHVMVEIGKDVDGKEIAKLYIHIECFFEYMEKEANHFRVNYPMPGVRESMETDKLATLVKDQIMKFQRVSISYYKLKLRNIDWILMS